MPSAIQMPIRPFRFGVQAKSVATRSEWVELARRVEGTGYSTLGLPDHFDDQLAPVPALQCAADATSTLRLGALVHDNDYKHPIVLAKELATMDVLTEGRIQIGLGAGWTATDYESSGIPYDPPGVRISRMIEGLSIIRSALGPDRFSFTGEHYTVTDYNGLPKPIQSPMPVLIGGGGPRMLRLAAREADIVGVNATLTSGVIDQAAFESMTADATDAKVGIVHDSARDVGRLEAIEMNVRAYMVLVTNDITGALQTLSDFTGASTELIERAPFALVGPPEKLVDDLLERRQRWGFSYVVVGSNDVEAFAPVVAQLAGA
jgi:probable F420-dependent oxidoreductase